MYRSHVDQKTDRLSLLPPFSALSRVPLPSPFSLPRRENRRRGHCTSLLRPLPSHFRPRSTQTDPICPPLLALPPHQNMTTLILNPQRLQRLATWEHLGESWYLVAAATLTVCNRPQEIPRLYHYAMHTRHTPSTPGPELYARVERVLDKFADISATGADAAYNPYAPDSLPGGPSGGPASRTPAATTDKVREGILKTAALSGLPRAINALTLLRDTTPAALRATAGPHRRTPENWGDYVAEQQRGRAYWDRVYTKISRRVSSQMASAYPDLWTYTLEHVYAPLLSFTDVLSAEETALVVVASLVPQDVNPQLKGHLRGAVNGGVPVATVRAARDLAVELGGWCGAVWRSPVARV